MSDDADLRALSTPPDFNVDTDLRFRSPRPPELLALWRGKHRGDALPARRDFSHEELWPHFGWLCVVDFLPSRDDLSYALVGTEIVELVGRDITRRLVSETLPPAALKIFLRLAERPRPVRTWGEVAWRDKPFMEHETLVLPLADDGATVDRFLLEMRFS